MTVGDGARASHRVLPRVAIMLSVCVIVVATLTPGGAGPVTGGPFCVTCPPHWLADIIDNVVLFVPLGLSLAARGSHVRHAVLFGAVGSLSIEALQFLGLPPGRSPAVADLISNTAGTALGAWVMWNASWLCTPTAAQARRLALLWAGGVALGWVAIEAALQPASAEQARSVVEPSVVPYTPGYGWLQPEVSGATVNGVFVAHRGTGAVRVAAARLATNTASVTMHGRDNRQQVVPIVFVHDPAMRDTNPRTTRAHLLLAQRGSDAWLSSDLRAGRWGLVVPALILRDVFAPGRDSVRLHATVTRRTWTLAAAGARQVRGVLQLSPLLGWAMVQSVVPVDSPLAPLLTVVWLACWVVPPAYWVSRWRRRA